MLLPFCLGFGTCDPIDVPEEDTCLATDVDAITSLEIGSADGEFEVWTDQTEVFIVIGGQGHAMIPLRVRSTGVQGSCMMTTIQAEHDGQFYAGYSLPLQLYPEGNAMITAPHYVILRPGPPAGSPIEISVLAAGQTTTVQVRIMQ